MEIRVNHLSDICQMNENKCSARTYKMIILKTPSLIEKEKRGFPTDIQWRREGVITPVKNQANCGSCQAFSATKSILTKNNVSLKLMELNQKQILDCTNILGVGKYEGCGKNMLMRQLYKWATTRTPTR